MKKFFLPIFAVLLVLGTILPLAAYRITRAVLSGAEPASSALSSPAASAQPPSAVPVSYTHLTLPTIRLV